MRNYPYTVDNGQGETLTFVSVKHESDGDRIYVDGVAQPGAGPPMHVHYRQEEAVRVVSGRIGYQLLGEAPKFAEAGDVVVWPAGTAHKWWNAGSTELRMSGWCNPPGNVEFFLATLFESVKRNGGRPGLFDAAFLMRRYRSEFGMLEIPAFVRNIVLPIVFVIGQSIGKYKRYSDAPAPLP